MLRRARELCGSLPVLAGTARPPAYVPPVPGTATPRAAGDHPKTLRLFVVVEAARGERKEVRVGESKALPVLQDRLIIKCKGSFLGSARGLKRGWKGQGWRCCGEQGPAAGRGSLPPGLLYTEEGSKGQATTHRPRHTLAWPLGAQLLCSCPKWVTGLPPSSPLTCLSPQHHIWLQTPAKQGTRRCGCPKSQAFEHSQSLPAPGHRCAAAQFPPHPVLPDVKGAAEAQKGSAGCWALLHAIWTPNPWLGRRGRELGGDGGHRANKRTCLALASRPLGHGRLITRYNPCQVLLPTPGPAAWPPAPRCSPRVSKCHPGARDLPEQSSDISVPVTFHQPRLPRFAPLNSPLRNQAPSAQREELEMRTGALGRQSFSECQEICLQAQNRIVSSQPLSQRAITTFYSAPLSHISPRTKIYLESAL